MSRTIHKYPLSMAGVQTVHLPDGAEILHVAPQRNMVCLWALVNPESAKVPRYILIAGTGHVVQEGPHLEHLGTFMLNDGALVFHAFEVMQ